MAKCFPKHRTVNARTKYIGLALGVTVAFFLIELIGSIITSSLALQSDAWHMLNHVVALSLGVAATWIATRPATTEKTFGYYRAEVLAAFLNGVFLWIIAFFIIVEAVNRIQQPSEVQSLTMLAIAVAGLGANGLSIFFLSKSGRGDSINIRGVLLHAVADALGSIAVISAGVIMLFTGFYVADPLFGILIGLLIFYSSSKLVMDSVNVLLEGVPPGMDANEVRNFILKTEGVVDVHDFHVWCVAPTKTCVMSCHIVTKKGINKRKLVSALISALKEKFGVDHPTIQVEEGWPYIKAAGEH